MSSMEKTLSKKDSAPEMLPKFDFLRSEHFGDNNVGYEDTEKDKHKISVPLKRINKKLNDILSEVQTKNDQVRVDIIVIYIKQRKNIFAAVMALAQMHLPFDGG